MDKVTEHILVGSVSSAHGLKGEVKIVPYTANAEDFFSYPYLYLGSNQKPFSFVTRSCQGKYVIGRFSHCHNRTDAEQLKGTKIFIDRKYLPSLEEDEFYYDDLLQMPVHLENGDHIGNITAIHDFGAGILLEIQFEDSKCRELFSFTKVNFPKITFNPPYILFVPPPIMMDDEEQSSSTE